MNGGWETSAKRSCETVKGKETTWKYCVNREHYIDILIETQKESKIFYL